MVRKLLYLCLNAEILETTYIFIFGNVSTQNDYPTIRVPGNVTELPEIWETKKSFPVSLGAGRYQKEKNFQQKVVLAGWGEGGMGGECYFSFDA